MPEKHTANRRAFLRKTAATVVASGGVLASADTVAAADQTLEVSGYGSYEVTVTDPDVTAGSDVEGDDEIRPGNGDATLDGTVANDTDTYEFDGEIINAVLDGHVSLDVFNPRGINKSGELTVNGSGGAYYFVKTNNEIETRYDNLESGDGLNSNRDACDGYLEKPDDPDDTDSYFAIGTIRGVTVKTTSDSTDWVTITHDL